MMTRPILILGVILAAGPAAAQERPPARSERYRISCEYGRTGAPVRQGKALGGIGVVQCTGKLDDAGTVATVQVMEHNGRWRDHGDPSDTADRGPRIKIYDGAPGRKGCYWYRMKYKHTGRHHGVTRSLPAVFSGATRQCF